jgi:hypothetical protein
MFRKFRKFSEFFRKDGHGADEVPSSTVATPMVKEGGNPMRPCGGSAYGRIAQSNVLSEHGNRCTRRVISSKGGLIQFVAELHELVLHLERWLSCPLAILPSCPLAILSPSHLVP